MTSSEIDIHYCAESESVVKFPLVVINYNVKCYLICIK